MPETEALAKNLKKYPPCEELHTEEMKETQAAFAYGCGLSEEAVSLMERKKTDPKLSTLKSIAAYTNHSVSEILEVKG